MKKQEKNFTILNSNKGREIALDSKQIIGQSIVFIENNLYEPLTASMVADVVSYSYYHFHRYFKAVMGETIGSYIRSHRLTQAAYELVHSDKKILDIAMSLYFDSAESFTRAFKKKYTITPTEYRKNGVDVLIANHLAVSEESLFESDYGNLVPKIVTFPQKRILGFRFAMSIQDNQSVAMWNRLNTQLSMQVEIPLNNYRYSIYEAPELCRQNTFSESSEATAFIGIDAHQIAVPAEMMLKEISGGKYARFLHKGTVDTLLATYRYIWGVWFPQSGYQLADRDDFECYTEKFLGPKNKDSEIEIYFPIL
jgi:AraC family transcriptional regulator